MVTDDDVRRSARELRLLLDSLPAANSNFITGSLPPTIDATPPMNVSELRSALIKANETLERTEDQLAEAQEREADAETKADRLRHLLARKTAWYARTAKTGRIVGITDAGYRANRGAVKIVVNDKMLNVPAGGTVRLTDIDPGQIEIKKSIPLRQPSWVKGITKLN